MFTSRRLFAVVLVIVLICMGCGKQDGDLDDPIVVKITGHDLSLSQVKAAYNQYWRGRAMAYQPPEVAEATDFWADADSAARAEYLEVTAQKELLVAYMEDKTGGEFSGREEIIYRRWWERRITHYMWIVATAEIDDPPQALVDSLAEIRSIEKKLTQIVCRFEEDAIEIYEKIQNGADYIQTGQDYAGRNPETTNLVPPNWIYQVMVVPEIWERLSGVTETDVIFPPFESKRFGWHIVRLDSLRTVDVSPTINGSPNPRMEGVRKAARETYQMGINSARFDRVMSDLDYQLITDNLSVLVRRISAMWDSLDLARAEGIEIDVQALNPPKHRFTAEELALPLAKAYGGVQTIGDLIESLYDVDLDYWPTPGTEEKLAQKIEHRFKRLAMHNEAKRIGCADYPGFIEEEKIQREKMYIDLFERDYIDSYTKFLNEADVSDYWQRNAEKYLSRDMVGYGYLLFPPMDEDIAWRTYEELKGSSEWNLGPTHARSADSNIHFVSQLDPGNGPEEITALALNYSPSENGLAVITEPLPLGEQFVILRVYHRSKPHTLTFEGAKDFVERDMKREATEDSLIAKLESLREKYAMEIFFDRLK